MGNLEDFDKALGWKQAEPEPQPRAQLGAARPPGKRTNTVTMYFYGTCTRGQELIDYLWADRSPQSSKNLILTNAELTDADLVRLLFSYTVKGGAATRATSSRCSTAHRPSWASHSSTGPRSTCRARTSR